MQNGRVIAHAKRERNLFTLDLAAPSQVMSARAMAIRGRGRPSHFESQKKRIRLWHRRLAHANNTRVVRVSKLINGVDLNLANGKEYDPSEIFIDSYDSETSANENKSPNNSILQPGPAPVLPIDTMTSALNPICQTKEYEDIDTIVKLCTPCVGSESTRSVRRNKRYEANIK